VAAGLGGDFAALPLAEAGDFAAPSLADGAADDLSKTRFAPALIS